MKKTYEKPEIEVIMFDKDDITMVELASSITGGGDPDIEDPGGDDTL